MAERPGPLGQLDRYFAAATIAHEYVADLHRELVALRQGTARTRELVRESAAILLERSPEVTDGLRRLGLEWGEQELLDPPRAERTLRIIESEFSKVEPELSALRARQDEIATQLRELVDRAL